MLKTPGFLESELQSPLLRLNRDDFLSNLNVDKCASLWKHHVFQQQANPSTPGTLAKTSEEERLETPRIIFMDVDRTFVQPATKSKLIDFLTVLQHRLKGDYHQALSYISGLMLLLMDEATAMDLILELGRNPKYLPGYFKPEPIDAATDSYVFQHVLNDVFPEVNSALNKHGLFPENYFQKWAVGLFTQILPPEALFRFFDQFLEHGYKFLFQFGLALVSGIKEQLMKANDFPTLFGLLRLDPKYILIQTKPNQFAESKIPKIDVMKLLDDATTFDLSKYNFTDLRKTLYDKHLKERIERANAFHKKGDSDSEDEDDDDDEDDGGEDCDFCHEFFPEYKCKECNAKICENCHTENKNNHKSTHSVKHYEPEEEESKGSDEEEEKDITKDMKKLSINGNGNNKNKNDDDDETF